MKIAILHYHLRAGGVTRVIENAVAALARYSVEVLVLTGEAPNASLPFVVKVIEGLGYANEKTQDIGNLLKVVREAVFSVWGQAPDLWHIHNHSLGKNTAFSELAYQLSQSEPVLLQVHDFAEDGRPANYAYLRVGMPILDHLYPAGAQVHYAVLNSRDHQLLKTAGFSQSNLHCLPNPVAIPDLAEASPLRFDRPLVVYPTRSIRRKNMGEWMLWALIAGNDFIFANTLSPANPQALPIYREWVHYAEAKKIPMEWALVERQGVPFEQVMASASAVFTTSVAEGFGLAFLEPWCLNKPLLGRDLPAITSDFKDAGVALEHLYQRLPIPVDWIGKKCILLRLKNALFDYYRAYGWSYDDLDELAEEAFLAMYDLNSQSVDFGYLDESMQRMVIDKIQGDKDLIQEFRFQEQWASIKSLPMARNKQCIASVFSLERYGENLEMLYRQVANSSIELNRTYSPEAVLKAFLNPKRFCLLRT